MFISLHLKRIFTGGRAIFGEFLRTCRGGGYIFAQRRSKKEELWNQPGPFRPEEPSWCFSNIHRQLTHFPGCSESVVTVVAPTVAKQHELIPIRSSQCEKPGFQSRLVLMNAILISFSNWFNSTDVVVLMLRASVCWTEGLMLVLCFAPQWHWGRQQQSHEAEAGETGEQSLCSEQFLMIPASDLRRGGVQSRVRWGCRVRRLLHFMLAAHLQPLLRVFSTYVTERSKHTCCSAWQHYEPTHTHTGAWQLAAEESVGVLDRSRPSEDAIGCRKCLHRNLAGPKFFSQPQWSGSVPSTFSFFSQDCFIFL